MTQPSGKIAVLTARQTSTGAPARRVERASPVDPAYAWPRLRPFKSIVVILAALAGIIALSLASVHHEHRRLVEIGRASCRERV